MTTGAEKAKGSKSKRKAVAPGTGIPERTALIPMRSSPGQPFSREAEAAEIKRLGAANRQIEEQLRRQAEETKGKEEKIRKLKVEMGM